MERQRVPCASPYSARSLGECGPAAERGSTAVKIIAVLLLVGALGFAAFQVMPVIWFTYDHQRFQRAIEARVQTAFDVYLWNIQELLADDIFKMLNAMNAQYEKQDVQVIVKEKQKSISVNVSYSRPHKSLFFASPKQFYAHTDTRKASDRVERARYNAPVVATDASFSAEVLQSQMPVMVTLWAPWCPYCREALPVLDEAARVFAGKIKIVTVNTDENTKCKSEYGLGGIPGFIFLKQGKVVAKQRGWGGRDYLFRLIQQHM